MASIQSLSLLQLYFQSPQSLILIPLDSSVSLTNVKLKRDDTVLVFRCQAVIVCHFILTAILWDKFCYYYTNSTDKNI